MCQSRIGLFSHNRTHRSWWWDPSYRRLSPWTALSPQTGYIMPWEYEWKKALRETRWSPTFARVAVWAAVRFDICIWPAITQMWMEKSAQRRRKHCALAVVRRSQKFRPDADPLPGGAGRPKFNQLEMVTTFTYRPSLVRIDARNFELPW